MFPLPVIDLGRTVFFLGKLRFCGHHFFFGDEAAPALFDSSFKHPAVEVVVTLELLVLSMELAVSELPLVDDVVMGQF